MEADLHLVFGPVIHLLLPFDNAIFESNEEAIFDVIKGLLNKILLAKGGRRNRKFENVLNRK